MGFAPPGLVVFGGRKVFSDRISIAQLLKIRTIEKIVCRGIDSHL
jgi:hypothetical protein